MNVDKFRANARLAVNSIEKRHERSQDEAKMAKQAECTR
jgi:hypothetical protein